MIRIDRGRNDRDPRASLILAAERLFVEQGIYGPSLREITRTAGHHNTSALQYHFGDRETLLRAVLERQGTLVDSHRETLLEQADRKGDLSLRTLAGALVLPLVACLSNLRGGPQYLQITGEVFARPHHFESLLEEVTTRSMEPWSKRAEAYLPPEAVSRPLHRRSAALRFTHSELAIRARERSNSDHRLFANHLIDMITAILSTPVSDETRRLIDPTRREPPPADQ